MYNRCLIHVTGLLLSVIGTLAYIYLYADMFNPIIPIILRTKLLFECLLCFIVVYAKTKNNMNNIYIELVLVCVFVLTVGLFYVADIVLTGLLAIECILYFNIHQSYMIDMIYDLIYKN